jgi:CO dehydrogenase/acetyl-CoA synthase epsilon subunit
LIDALRWARKNSEEMKNMAKKAERKVLVLPPKTWEEYLEMYRKLFEIS